MLRSCENLHLAPFWHVPALKYWQRMDLGSTPAPHGPASLRGGNPRVKLVDSGVGA